MAALAPARPVQPPRWAARVALLLFAALGAGALLDPASPPAAPLDAPEDAFSAARALALLEVIALEPRPTGSAANERVRGFLVEHLGALGLEVEVEPWTDERAGWDGKRPVAGWNVVARLPGRTGSGGRAALFVAHYDSRPDTPGAADDGAAVAALLETARALRAGPANANDLLFLFTDAEELGLLGALAFCARRSSLDGIAAVLDFEARGNGGGSILFETGPRSGALLLAYAACVPWPLASSLGPTVYERLPNDTDFSVFKRHGLPGLNFAFIAGGSAYHAPADRVENLDLRSLQHHGTIALALARRLGRQDLSILARAPPGGPTFFTLPGNVLVMYPGTWDLGVGLLSAATLLAALVFGLRTRVLSAPSLLLATLGWPVFAVLLFGAILGTWWLVHTLSGWIAALLSITGVPRGNLLSGTVETLGLAAWTAFLLAALAQRAPSQWLDALSAGSAIAWCLLLVPALALARGASHVLAWPLFCSTLALHASLRARARPRIGGVTWLCLWVLVVPGFCLLLSVLKLFHQVGSVAPQGGAVLASAVLALSGGLILPQVERIVRSAPRCTLLLAGGLGAGSLLGGALLHLAGR